MSSLMNFCKIVPFNPFWGQGVTNKENAVQPFLGDKGWGGFSHFGNAQRCQHGLTERHPHLNPLQRSLLNELNDAAAVGNWKETQSIYEA
eukprot:532060-Amphidinium_carterae.2